ncbi:MAG: class D sortase [Paenisporosarcina sp.]
MLKLQQRERRMPKKAFLLSFAILVMFVGIWLLYNNISSFSKGIFAEKKIETEVITKVSKNSSPTPKSHQKEKLLYPERPKMGEEIGTLYIPKLESELPIFHGTNEDELEKGVGHFKESVLPGEKDNSVLSGHRDTVFRNLGKVGKGDELQVTTAAGIFTYKVMKVRIVDEDDRTVIVPKPRAVLTVSTCYPFDFIGAAPERYILEAYLVSSEIN